MKVVSREKNKCTGCSACYSICRIGAIAFKEDPKGFLYPEINADKCIKCGVCKQVCPILSELECNVEQEYCVAVNKNEDVLMNSRSGGVFSAFSDWILENDGVVYGVVYTDEHTAIHVRAEDACTRDAMRGSKYIQSIIHGTFSHVEDDLKNDKFVLFTGTPCQCDGLLHYLEKRNCITDNLFVIDIICHGVPSPLLWKNHIDYLEKRYKGRIEKIIFRDKEYGWKSHYESFWVNGKKYTEEKFKRLFYSNVCLRDSCYECKYSSLKRVSDVTIGDAWSANDNNDNNGDKGTSIVMVNTAKGKMIFEQTKSKLLVKSVDINDYMQHNLKTPSIPQDDVDGFWNSYESRGYSYIMFVWGESGFLNKGYKKIRRNILKLTRGRNNE